MGMCYQEALQDSVRVEMTVQNRVCLFCMVWKWGMVLCMMGSAHPLYMVVIGDASVGSKVISVRLIYNKQVISHNKLQLNP